MNKLLSYLFLLAALLLDISANTHVHAQQMASLWQPIVTNYSPQDYAAGTQNWRLLQNENGWLYAANNYGLLEYDGREWRIYGIWNSSALHSLCRGPQGEIYVGGSNEFGVFAPNKDGDLVYRPLTDSVPTAARSFGDVWNMAYDEGTLYVTCRNHIFIVQENGHTEVIDPACIVYASLLRDHCLYLATSNGIYLYSGHRLHTLEGSQLLHGLTISAMTPYGPNAFLIATDFRGLFLYDGSAIRPFHTEVDEFFRRNQLYSIAVSEHHIAFGTVLRGLVVTDLRGQHPIYMDRHQGLQNNTVLSVAFDRDQNLWLGLDQGIDQVLLHAPFDFLNNIEEDYGSGYAYAETAEGAYFGTNQGLYFLPKGSSQLRLIEGSMGQVWRLVKQENSLYCCHNRGLFRVTAEQLTQLPIPEGVWNILPLDGTHAVACTYNGFYLLEEGAQGYRVRQRLSGYDETVLYADLDAYGRVWTISSRGVERITFSDSFTSLKSELMLSDPQRSRYAIGKIGSHLIVSAEGYIATAQADGTLHECDTLAGILGGKHKYEILQTDSVGNLIYMHDARLYVRGVHPASGPYTIDPNTHTYVPVSADAKAVKGSQKKGRGNCEYGLVVGPEQLVLDNVGFFVGGFANLTIAEGGYAVLGGVEGFCRLNVTRAVGMPYPEPWDERPVKIIVPWYRSWWAILSYVALLGLLAFLTLSIIRSRIRERDERLAAEKLEEIHKQQVRILELEREKMEFDLKAKSKELNSVLLNQVNRNELSQQIQQDVVRISEVLAQGDVEGAQKGLRQLAARLGAGMHADKDWKRFEENFDFVNDRFIRRLTERFPWMSKQEKKLCVYIYMGLQTKEIAPLLNLSNRGVEMMRYRARRKMGLDAQANLKHYFEELLQEE